MAAATNSVRRISRGLPKSPNVTPPPLSIAPRGNRALMPTVNRSRRITAKPGERNYSKEDEPLPPAFDLAGFRGE